MPDPAAALPIAYPLDDFYARDRRSLPPIEAIDGSEMPDPYRSLLVHQRDMTPTLEAFHGDSIHIRVLHHQQRDDFLFREVVLELDSDGRPVEFGAIKINLAPFKAAARRLILEQRLPLGRILSTCQVQHQSHPKAFLTVQADDFMRETLRLEGDHLLYGRRNTLSTNAGVPFAEIVEILPP